MCITEAEEIKKEVARKHRRTIQKKVLMTWKTTMMWLVTHLKPDILECEVKWALGTSTTKLMEVMEFQLTFFKS